MLATLSTTRTEELLADGDPRGGADGRLHLAFAVAAALVVAALVLAVTALRPAPAAEEEAVEAAPAYSEV